MKRQEVEDKAGSNPIRIARLQPGNLFIEGVDSPHSLLAATKGVYGESAGEWSAEDALGYARILSLTGSLQTRAGQS